MINMYTKADRFLSQMRHYKTLLLLRINRSYAANIRFNGDKAKNQAQLADNNYDLPNNIERGLGWINHS